MLRATLLAASAAAAAAGTAPLTNLTDPLARCMDGTLSGYYLQPASTPRGKNRWVIYLEGGGECTTQGACESHLHDPLGSSKYFAKDVDFGGAFYASDDAAGNPDFFDWNHVDVPYCSQDLHSGQVRLGVGSGEAGRGQRGQGKGPPPHPCSWASCTPPRRAADVVHCAMRLLLQWTAEAAEAWCPPTSAHTHFPPHRTPHPTPHPLHPPHLAQMTAPSNATWGLYFSGHHVFTAILDALDKSAGLAAATEIILTGASAGGIGVWINVDFLAERYPAARVVAAPVAGFYFYAYPYTGINHTSSDLADFRPAAWPITVALWQAFYDQSCAAALPATPWACMLRCVVRATRAPVPHRQAAAWTRSPS
jgi:hypothetical protein